MHGKETDFMNFMMWRFRSLCVVESFLISALSAFANLCNMLIPSPFIHYAIEAFTRTAFDFLSEKGTKANDLIVTDPGRCQRGLVR